MSNNKCMNVKYDRMLVTVCAILSVIQLSTADIASGIVSTFAGVQATTGSFSGDGGSKILATFKVPNGVWANTLSQVYIADSSNYRLRMVDTTGTVSTVFGTGSSSVSGNTGPASSASGAPYQVCGDSTGNVYFTDSSNGVARKINSAGIVTAFAGGGTLGSTTSNADNGGAATASAFSFMNSCQVDTLGDVYITSTNYNKVKKVTAATNIINTIAGSGSQASPDTSANNGNGGKATSAKVSLPTGIWLDSANNLYMASYSSGSIRVVNLDSGIITQAAGGTGTSGYSGDGGSATSAKLTSGYTQLAGDTAGNLYYSSASYHNIRVVSTTAGIINTLAGTSGSSGYAGDGSVASSTNTKFKTPQGMFVVPSAGLLVAEAGNNIIRLIGADWTTVATTAQPSVVPTVAPSAVPTAVPTVVPTVAPTVAASAAPSAQPSVVPSATPSVVPTAVPSVVPTVAPTVGPTKMPSVMPTALPTVTPSAVPSVVPTTAPTTAAPTMMPTVNPTVAVGSSASPTVVPTAVPSQLPSVTPTAAPSVVPTTLPTEGPTVVPSVVPTVAPSALPTVPGATTAPSVVPTLAPTAAPSTAMPSQTPTTAPTAAPSLLAVTIAFESHIYLHNASATTLDGPCQSAVVEAVAQTLQLSPSKVTYLSQGFIGAERRRLSAGQNRYQVMVAVSVQASTTDFVETASRNASYLYTKLSSALTTAVDSSAFSTTVRETSVTFNAVATRYVGTVNLTMTGYSVVDTSSGSGKNSLVAVGGAVGVAMIVLFGVVALAASIYFCHTARIYKNKNKVFVAASPETECVSPA